MGVRRIGKRPVLWLTSVANQEHLGHTAGIEAVWARVLVPDNGLSLDTLQALAKASRDWTRGSWNWSRGQYQLGRIRTGLQSTVNGGLTTDLKEVWSGSGTALIVNSRGAMVALAAGSEQSLWARHAIGQALLPPMLALAVTVPAVRKALEQPHSELTGVALAWGTDDVRRGLQTLGVTVDATRRWRKPSTQMIMDSLSQGSSLTATPLQLAQSYLPFVSGGRIGPVWVRQTRPPLGHTIDGEFGRVLQQLPAVTLAGTRFRVWRPVGSYAIVIAPKQHQIAILEGDWVNAAVSVMQVMANGHQPSLPSGR
jgi:cell division protein FtsI/penicillin-binding protein 2